jgi:hypothetical protein
MHASQAYAPVHLLRVETGGQGLSLVRVILDRPLDSVPCSVDVDPGDRLATVLIDRHTYALVDSIDMDRPERVNQLRASYDAAPGLLRVCAQGFLARTADGRVLQAMILSGELAGPGSIAPHPSGDPGVTGFSLLGVQLSPSTSDLRIEQLTWEDTGRLELSTVGWGEGLHWREVGVDKLGALSLGAIRPGPLGHRLNNSILRELPPKQEDPYHLEANTRDWLALLRVGKNRSTGGEVGASFHDILDKRSGSWRTFEVPGTASVLKNFGDWMAGTVIDGNSSKQSPGREHRKDIYGGRRQSPVEPTADYAWSVSNQYSPGELSVLNARSGKQYTIETHEGDSEVLLVENGTIYYRVNDSIFRAPIGQENVGTPVLMATDPHIPDVHWAFLGPPTEATTRKP